MESRAKLLGHPIHQMLIPLPLGLLTASVAFDALHRMTDDRSWQSAASATLGAGLASGFVAAPFGLVDWLAIPGGTRAKRVGALHALSNLTAMGLYGASWMLRRADPDSEEAVPLALSLAGLAVSGIAGWLGGELVGRLGVGVDPGANLDAPSSLSNQPAGAGLEEPTAWPPTAVVDG
jgi:uncharacterized membrane protein